MHMNSAGHLLAEDRPEFERLLDDVLRDAHNHPDLAAVGHRLNTEQLRTMARNATALITAAATTEYTNYVKVRDQYRDPETLRGAAGDTGADRSGTTDLAVGMSEDTENTGAGLLAIVAVLAPMLSGTASAIFLLVGYILKMLTPEPAFADTMLTAGWLFGALTAAGILVAAVGLLLTALRNGANSVPAGQEGKLPEELVRARDAWREALLERGILPFLREALAETAPPPSAPPRPPGRTPQLGYTRPGFSSPGTKAGSTPSPRPSFSSPDYTSPDYGGPEHQPD
jgi:hypothetical protein